MAAPVAVSGLSPYAGSWGREQAAHLLRRTMFGPKKAELTAAISMGLTGTLDQLFGVPTQPSPPVNHFYTMDPNVPIGSTWVNSPHVAGADVGQYRYPGIRGWYWQNLLHHDFNIMARMTMFWINHFGMSDVGEHRAQYQYLRLFNEFGTDNFQRMIEKVTINPGMLNFLNGEYSHKWEPNENYARELLELFTIQKGPQVAPEDYTHYTEEDIRVIARLLTGWRNNGMWSETVGTVESWFDPNWHDTDPKQLSHRFDNVVIQNVDHPEEEYKDLIAVIFSKLETARAFCREVYRFFVYYDIDDTIESTIIEPMATMLFNDGYDLQPTLRLLFGSQHFYDMAVRGPLIKSPYDFTVSMARPLGGYSHLGLDLSDNTAANPLLRSCYNLGGSHHWWNTNMDMDFLFPPTVAGWKAFYQTPGYYRNWIGSATLKQRKSLVDAYTGSGMWTETEIQDQYAPRPFDYFAFVATLEAPQDPNELVAESAQIFLPRELHPDQLEGLKQQLIPDLPDQEWTTQYDDYLASPFNPDVANPVYNKLRAFYRALFSMAEFHLM